MKNITLCLSILTLASSAFAGDLRNTTRDSGGYEAALRNAGIPLSGGMAWPVLNPRTKTVSPEPTTFSGQPKTSIRAADIPTIKSKIST